MNPDLESITHQNSGEAIKKIPPVAKGSIPLFGHLFAFRKDPFTFLNENCKTMGPVFSFKLMSRNFYVLNHPDLVKHVLVTNAKNYSRKRSYQFLEEMLGRGLLTTEGEEWRKKRRIAQPAFYKDQLEHLLQQMEVSIEKYLEALHNRSNDIIDLDIEMNHLTLSVLSNSIIQSDLESRISLVKVSLRDALKYLTQKRFSAFKWLQHFPGNTKSEGRQGIKTLKSIVMEIIEDRRNSNIIHKDLLSMLMASTDDETKERLSNQELLDEVMTMFIAGHDTTAVVLTWAFHLIGRHPEIEEKMVKEIRENSNSDTLTMNELRNFPYIKMVIQEVMRLYPPVWTFGRRAINDDNNNGYYVPANTFCTMPALFVHRNPEFWEKPDEFYPEHFMPEKVKERNKHAYFPFSAGQHFCIGEHYAQMEIQLVLIHILKKYKVRLLSDQPVGMQLLITLKPASNIFAKLEKRI